MGLSVALYLLLLAAVGLERLIELRVSARNQRRLAVRGFQRVPDPSFSGMVVLHATVPIVAAAEVVLGHRPFLPALGLATGTLFLLAQGLRWWVIRALADHWNVQVVASTGLGVVSHGPYRFLRHPNYTAVFVEMLALPLIHTAWITALATAPAHALLLRRRIATEEAVLLADPVYRRHMGSKPRFVPRLVRHRAVSGGAGAPARSGEG
jgi:methyltransferase